MKNLRLNLRFLTCRRLGVALCVFAVALPVAAGPPLAAGSITYTQYAQTGGGLGLPPAPFLSGGKPLEINRDAAYVAPGLAGILASQVGTFIVVGAGMIAAGAVAKNIKEAVSKDSPPPAAVPCPAGQEEINGACVAECRSDQVRQGGVCGCPGGQTEVGGVCMASGGGNTCRPDQIMSGGNCVCPGGQTEVGGVCMASGGGNTCRPDQIRQGNDCVCNSGQEEVNNACVAECRNDQVRQGGVCGCPGGQTEVGGVCMASGGGNTRTEAECNGMSPPRVLRSGACELPMNTAECQRINSGDEFYGMAADNCRPASCPTGLRDANMENCRDFTESDCNGMNPPRILRGGACELPQDNAECQSLTAGQIYDAAAAGNCRLPNNDAECQSLTAGQIHDTAQPTNCRLPNTANAVEVCRADRNNVNTGAKRVFTPVAAGTQITLSGTSITLDDDKYIVGNNRGLIGKIITGLPNDPLVDLAHVWLRDNGAWQQIRTVDGSGVLFGTAANNRKVVAGDVIAVISGSGGSGNALVYQPANEIAIFRVYGGTGNDRRLAIGEITDARRTAGATLPENADTGCEVSGNKFFLSSSWAAVTDIGTSQSNADLMNPAFREILGGMLNKNNSVQWENFSFTADSSLKNIHMEYRLPEKHFGGMVWRAHSGYRSQDGGKTRAVYHKTSASYQLSPQAELYAVSQTGAVRSEIYGDLRLAGFAAGMFYNGWRRGDAFRAGIEAPLGETNTVRHPTLSAAAKIGADKNTAHLQLYRELKGGGKSGARFLFRREF